MKPKSEKSIELYHMLLDRGYPEPFCDEVTKNLNTDFPATRMMGYLSHYRKLPMEEIADEVPPLLDLRNSIMKKHVVEDANAAYNEYLMNRFDDKD